LERFQEKRWQSHILIILEADRQLPCTKRFTSRAEQAIPDAQQVCVVRVGVVAHRMMMNPMDRRRDYNIGQRFLKPGRQSQI
jgi:hypothetical protein